MSKVQRLQILLEPVGRKTLGEAAIFMPEELSAKLREIFSFEAMCRAEFEGDKIFEKLGWFASFAKQGNICRINYDMGEEGKDLYILSHINFNDVSASIDFIRDQLSDSPHIECAAEPYIKETVFSNKNLGSSVEKNKIIGWYNLDQNNLIFVDSAAAYKFQILLNLWKIPSINQELEYIPSAGSTSDKTKKDLQKLSDAWGVALSSEHNPGQIVSVKPRGVSLDMA